MLYTSRLDHEVPTKGIVDRQVGDPFKKWIDGEILTENTFDEFHNYLFGTKVFENTDPLIKERGFRILDKMIDTDPSIKNAYWSRIFTILSGGYSINPMEEGCERSEEIANFVKWNFMFFCKVSVASFLRKLLDSQRQGFKLAEIIWKVIEDEGPYKGKIGIYDLIVRDSRNYSFLTDEKGRMDPMGVIEGISSTGFWTTDGEPRQLPTNKFVIYSYLALDDDAASIYGNSDFRALWRAFYGDLTAHRLELRSAETFARPPLVGSVSHGEYTKPEQDKILKDLIGAYNRVYTQIPEGVKVEEIGVKRSDTRAFQSLRERHHSQIKNGMLMGTQGGSGDSDRESVKIQTQMLVTNLDAISSDISDVVMERQVIRKLVDVNYQTQKYPSFMVPKLAIDRKNRADFISILIERGVIAPDEPWIRTFVDVPKQDMATRNRQISKKNSDKEVANAATSAIVSSGKLDNKSNTGFSLINKSTELSMSGNSLILEAFSHKDVREFNGDKNQINVDKILDFMVVIKEKDNGQISIDSIVKDGVQVSDFEKQLEKIVDENPQNKFFIAKVFGERKNIDGDGVVKLMRVIRVISPEPRDRVVVVE